MRTLKILCAITIGLTSALSEAHATAQREDILITNGQEQSIQTNPLEPFLDMHPQLRPESEIYSTSLWRRYVATWELSDGQLLLIDIEVLRWKPGTEEFETELHSVMADAFPRGSPVVAEWFTGYIIVPRGELIEYVHMGYASVFEHYSVLTIVDGHLVGEEQMTSGQFREFRKNQFLAYQETEEYKSEFKELENSRETPEEVESFLFRYFSGRYTSIIFDRDP